MNHVNSFFSQAKERLSSIDIETSGLSVEKDFVWSIGTAGKLGDKEHFITAPKESLDRLFKENIFGIEGYHDAYKSALANRDSVTFGRGITKAFEQMDQDSMILIQNANFENNFLAEALRGGDGAVLEKRFDFVKDKHKGKLLYTPPEVTIKRHEAMRTASVLGRTKDPVEREALLKSLNSTYNKMFSEYDVASKRKAGAIVVELMDVSRAMYSLAASKNQIDSRHIGTGLTVDFLKKALFPGTGGEKHTAQADAEDQIKIFNRLGKMFRQMDSGKMSVETQQTFARIKAAQPFESSKQFISGLRSTLEEIQRDGGTRLINPNTTYLAKDVYSGVEYSHLAPDYFSDKHSFTSSPKEARDHVVERYMNRGTAGLNTEEFSDSLDNKTLDEQISFLKSKEAEFKDKVTRRISGNVSVGEKVKDFLPNMKHKKKIALGALAVGLYALASDGEERVNSYKEKEEEMLQSRSNDRTFSMYSKPGVYHGEGFYMWDNRSGHHQSMGRF